jgi:hypothetical protein
MAYDPQDLPNEWWRSRKLVALGSFLLFFPFLMWGALRFEELRLNRERFEWQKAQELYRREHPVCLGECTHGAALLAPPASGNPPPAKTPQERGSEVTELIGKAADTGTTRPPPGLGHPIADAIMGAVTLLGQLGSVPMETVNDVSDTLKKKVLDKGLDLAADVGKHIIDKLFEPEPHAAASNAPGVVQIFNSCCCQTPKRFVDRGPRGPEQKGSEGPEHKQKPLKQKSGCHK